MLDIWFDPVTSPTADTWIHLKTMEQLEDRCKMVTRVRVSLPHGTKQFSPFGIVEYLQAKYKPQDIIFEIHSGDEEEKFRLQNYINWGNQLQDIPLQC